MSEQRCSHGFLRSVVPCPECDPERFREEASSAEGQKLSRTGRQYKACDLTDEAIAEALASTGQLVGAARQLGISQNAIYGRARRSSLVRAALDQRPSLKTGTRA